MGVPNDVTILEVLGVFLTPLSIVCAAFAQCYFIRAGLIQMREASKERNRHLDNLEEMIRQQGEMFADIGVGIREASAGIREASAGIREASAGIRHLIEKQNQAPPP